jgi:biotin carboxylase
MKKANLGVFYWHNPTRIGNLELINDLRQGFNVTIISNSPAQYVERYADHTIVEHYGNSTTLIEKIRKHKNTHGLDGLITLSEGAVTLMADAAAKLGLRGNDPKATRVGRNKYLMRKAMAAAGIPQPKFFRAHSYDEALTIAQEFDGAFFLKPPCIGGSSYCTVVSGSQQLKDYWWEFYNGSKERTTKDPLFEEQFGEHGKNYYLLLEELLGGTQFTYDDVLGPGYPVFEMSVEGFIHGDDTLVYSMTDKLLPANCTNGQEFMWRMHSRIPPKLKKVLENRVSKINRILQATCGCSHTEFRIEETDKAHADIEHDGQHYSARMIETALRPGGAFMQPAIALATGFNSIRASAYQACGIEHDEQVLYRRPTIMANFWANKSGKITKILGLDKILSLKEQIAAFHLYDGIGDRIEIPPVACRGIADAVFYGRNVDLLKYPGWETLSGEASLYKEVERNYIDVANAFKPVVVP